jgi:18S rRNA (guanine1575-N7)-methyltransferase
MGRGDRPELTAPPEIFYNDEEARKYTTNSRMIEIQVREDKEGKEKGKEHFDGGDDGSLFLPTSTSSSKKKKQASLTARALELLNLPQDGRRRLLLDLGCGSGLSGDAITESGNEWVGMDISAAMLGVAVERGVTGVTGDGEEGSGGDLLLGDLGHGLPLRSSAVVGGPRRGFREGNVSCGGTTMDEDGNLQQSGASAPTALSASTAPGLFDGAVSISAVQWLCNADTARADPRRRLRRFFETLYSCLRRGARAALQVYPSNPEQASMMVSAAMRAGFGGGIVVDFPNSTRAKKHFLVLMVGGGGALPAAKDGMGSDDDDDDEGDGNGDGVRVQGRSNKRRNKKGSFQHSLSARHPDAKGGKSWVLRKKQQMREKGYGNVPADSRYTGRRRKSFIL